jgi:hypothetical protein
MNPNSATPNPAPRKQFSRRAVSKKFLDIVGYSKLLADEQKELVQELNRIVRETKQFQAADAAPSDFSDIYARTRARMRVLRAKVVQLPSSTPS